MWSPSSCARLASRKFQLDQKSTTEIVSVWNFQMKLSSIGETTSQCRAGEKIGITRTVDESHTSKCSFRIHWLNFSLPSLLAARNYLINFFWLGSFEEHNFFLMSYLLVHCFEYFLEYQKKLIKATQSNKLYPTNQTWFNRTSFDGKFVHLTAWSANSVQCKTKKLTTKAFPIWIF